MARPASRPAPAGWVESDRREPADWAEFVTLALTGAAANVGSIEAALRGRPGSWEADGARSLLQSTAGERQAVLHRTAPPRTAPSRSSSPCTSRW